MLAPIVNNRAEPFYSKLNMIVRIKYFHKRIILSIVQPITDNNFFIFFLLSAHYYGKNVQRLV